VDLGNEIFLKTWKIREKNRLLQGYKV